MKTTEFKTTLKGMTELLLNNEPVIKQNLDGEIVVQIELQPISCTTKVYSIVVARYSGSLSCNNGLSRADKFPVQMTEKAREIWDTFVKYCEKELLQFIKEN